MPQRQPGKNHTDNDPGQHIQRDMLAGAERGPQDGEAVQGAGPLQPARRRDGRENGPQPEGGKDCGSDMQRRAGVAAGVRLLIRAISGCSVQSMSAGTAVGSSQKMARQNRQRAAIQTPNQAPARENWTAMRGAARHRPTTRHRPGRPAARKGTPAVDSRQRHQEWRTERRLEDGEITPEEQRHEDARTDGFQRPEDGDPAGNLKIPGRWRREFIGRGRGGDSGVMVTNWPNRVGS